MIPVELAMTPALFASPLAATGAFGSLLGAYMLVAGSPGRGRWMVGFGILVLLLESLIVA